jgi:hypothetical protein
MTYPHLRPDDDLIEAMGDDYALKFIAYKLDALIADKKTGNARFTRVVKLQQMKLAARGIERTLYELAINRIDR